MDITIKHNFDEFAKELEKLSGKQFSSMFKRSMTRALKKGRATSSKMLKFKIKPPKGTAYGKYFNSMTSISSIKGSIDKFEGNIRYSSKRRGLAAYTTTGKLERHRKSVSKAAFNSTKLKKVKPLEFDIGPGKKTKLKKAFAAKKNGKWQVFRRKGEARLPLDRPTGPSIAQAVRSNDVVVQAVHKSIDRAYKREFTNALKFRTDKALSKARRAKLR